MKKKINIILIVALFSFTFYVPVYGDSSIGITTLAATNIGTNSATLNGVVTDALTHRIYQKSFEYGTSTSYGKTFNSPTANVPQVEQNFSLTNTAGGKFSQPFGLDSDSSGNIYVADKQNNRIQKFDPNGNFLLEFGRPGVVGDTRIDTGGYLKEPSDVDVAANGNIYVVDTGNHRIQVFDSNGNYLFRIGRYDGTGALTNPTAIAHDSDSNIWVTSGNLVTKYNSTGTFLLVLGTVTGGSTDGLFQGAGGIAVDSSNKIFVTDIYNHRVQIFDSNGNFISKFGTQGIGDGQFTYPIGIDFDDSNNAHVVDTNYSNIQRVQRFTNSGNYVSKFGTYGSGPGQFLSAYGISVISDGSIHVTDTQGNKVTKFNNSGSYLSQFGTQGPRDVAPRSSTVDSQGNVYVEDTTNSLVYKFSSTGTLLTQFSIPNIATYSYSYPTIRADHADNLYLSDPGNHRFYIYNTSGVLLTTWGTQGSGNGQFNLPSSIGFDSANNIYVLDTSNYRVQKFDSSRNFLTSFGSTGTGDGQFITPVNLAVGPDDHVFVADANYSTSRVQEFTSTGTYVGKFGSNNNPSSTNVNVYMARHLAVDSFGNIYLGDYVSRIQIISPEYKMIGQWNAHGSHPDGLMSTVSDITIGLNDSLFVSDSSRFQVTKYYPSTQNGTFSFVASGLTCNTLYHYRTVVETETGTVLGEDQTFTTEPCLTPPTTNTGSTSNITRTTADLSGSINNTLNTDLTTRGFQYGTTTSYGSTVTDNSPSDLIFGSQGTGNGQFTVISNIATDNTGNIFVADNVQKRIQKFDPQGNFLLTFGSSGTGNGQFGNIVDIKTDNDGNIIVIDSGNNNLQKFDSQGNFLFRTSVWQPTALGIDGNGYIYTTEYSPPQTIILKLTPTGEIVDIWGHQGSGDGQTGYTSFRITASGNRVYLFDSALERVEIFDTDGNFLSQWGPDSEIEVSIGSIKSDSAGNVYFMSSFQATKYDATGKFLRTHTIPGSYSGTGYAVTPGGNIITSRTTGGTNPQVIVLNGYLSSGTYTKSLSNLSCGTTYHYRSYSTNNIDTSYGNDATFTTSACTAPTVTTGSTSNITFSTATAVTTITDNGGSIVTSTGVQYGTTASYGSTATSGTNITGNNNINITGLSCGTTYHYRSFATNSVGTGYGEDSTLTTSPCAAPTVSNSTVTPSGTSATTYTNITSNGGGTITSTGVQYGTTTSYGSTTISGSNNTGYNYVSISGLNCGTTYHYRSFATNSVGTAYADDATFTTSTCTLAAVTTNNASSITATTATANAYVTDTGNSAITVAGVEYGTTTSYGLTATSSTTYAGYNYIYLTGLSCATTYHYRSYATNAAGTAYGIDKTFTTSTCPNPPTVFNYSVFPSSTDAYTYTNITSNGGSNVTSNGVEYGTTTSYGSTATSSTNNVGFNYVPITGLSCGTTYHYRSFATNIAGTSYDNDSIFTTNACITSPVVGSGSEMYPSYNRIVIVWDITSNGGATVSSTGVQYGTTDSYGSTSNSTSPTSSNHSVVISSLACGETYHYRIYASNSAGTTYGSDQTFETLACEAPNLNPQSVFNITLHTADGYSHVTEDGGTPLIETGIEYGTTTTYGSSAISSTNDIAYNDVFITGLTCGTTYHYRSYATNSTGTSYTGDNTFTTASCDLPDVGSYTINETTKSSARFTINIDGQGAGVLTEAGINITMYSSTGPRYVTNPHVGNNTVNVTNLSCGHEYIFKVFASNGYGTNDFLTGSFSTETCPISSFGEPTLSDGNETDVNIYNVTVIWDLYTQGDSSVNLTGVEYGLDTSYGQTYNSYHTNTGSHMAYINALACNTEYHFRTFATNSYGTGYGQDRTFTTAECPVTPTVVSTGTVPYREYAYLGIEIPNNGGDYIQVRGAQYGLTDSYGETSSNVYNTSELGDAVGIYNLACNTTYHYRLYATNSAGTTYTDDYTFTTAACLQPSDINVAAEINNTTVIHSGDTVSYTVTITNSGPGDYEAYDDHDGIYLNVLAPIHSTYIEVVSTDPDNHAAYCDDYGPGNTLGEAAFDTYNEHILACSLYPLSSEGIAADSNISITLNFVATANFSPSEDRFGVIGISNEQDPTFNDTMEEIMNGNPAFSVNSNDVMLIPYSEPTSGTTTTTTTTPNNENNSSGNGSNHSDTNSNTNAGNTSGSTSGSSSNIPSQNPLPGIPQDRADEGATGSIALPTIEDLKKKFGQTPKNSIVDYEHTSKQEPFLLLGTLSITGSNAWDAVILGLALLAVGVSIYSFTRKRKILPQVANEADENIFRGWK